MFMTDITDLIEQAFAVPREQKARQYIGASGIGQQCEASIAFSFRGYPDTPPDSRLSRIFRDGHRIEYVVVSDMRKAGLHVMENDPVSGKQWRFEGYGGLVMGNADGLLEMDGETVGLEIKSMNDNKHKEFIRKGIKGSHPSYFDQMQFMMGLSGIERFVIVAYNKNTSMYHHEYIDFDFKRGACWNKDAPAERSVRTCGNSYAENDGSFKCDVCDALHCTSWKLYEPKPRG